MTPSLQVVLIETRQPVAALAQFQLGPLISFASSGGPGTVPKLWLSPHGPSPQTGTVWLGSVIGVITPSSVAGSPAGSWFGSATGGGAGSVGGGVVVVVVLVDVVVEVVVVSVVVVVVEADVDLVVSPGGEERSSPEPDPAATPPATITIATTVAAPSPSTTRRRRHQNPCTAAVSAAGPLSGAAGAPLGPGLSSA
ncbi:MAG: hypothetical protein JXA83_15925 [Acidimicrobiales bacterium]|nr:hypothetical protein [Acidimicrobiales bacterium]